MPIRSASWAEVAIGGVVAARCEGRARCKLLFGAENTTWPTRVIYFEGETPSKPFPVVKPSSKTKTTGVILLYVVRV